ALIAVVYWHLLQISVRGVVQRCAEVSCRAFFVQTRRTQRFCPAEDLKRESRCAVRARRRAYRQKTLRDLPAQERAAHAEPARQGGTLGCDRLWLAERPFSPPGRAALVPAIGSAPLLLATAIAMRTSRSRLGSAVLLLPLGHPVRLAEEVATLDQLSQGRLHLGIGRSSFPRAYEGYGIPYAESRARFQQYLDIMRLAWTQPQFSYTGTFYTMRDVEVLPKPWQHRHPPLSQATAAGGDLAAVRPDG